MEPHAEATDPEAPPLPPLWKRAVDTVFSPGAMAEAVAARPAWFMALLVGASLVALQTFLVPAEIWEAQFRQNMLNQQQQMPEGFAMSGDMLRISGTIGGVLVWFVFSFLMAGVVTLIFAFFLGDEGRYTQYLSVMAHAWLIPAIAGLMLVPLRIAQGNPQLTLNLATFFYFLEPGYWKGVLTFLDLSQLWAWAVIAQGVHVIDRRRSFGSALTILLVLLLLMALAFGRFMPTT
ncbi:MAG: YIP1 family protein [Longimicrobiales bacterium]